MDSIRVFVAVALGNELKGELRAVQQKLQDLTTVRVVRWVAPENIHLTLKFLGEVDATRQADLTAALQESASTFGPFTLTVRGLGCFPNARRPNVIWAGLDGQVPLAIELARRVEDAYHALGFARDSRPFSPHLTLGRIRREARPSDRAAIGTAVEQFPAKDHGIIVSDSVHLIRSVLTADGSIYTALATVHLYDSLPRPP